MESMATGMMKDRQGAYDIPARSGRRTPVVQSKSPPWQIWSAIGSMTLCVAMLIASEFMPVSLLTPIAA